MADARLVDGQFTLADANLSFLWSRMFVVDEIKDYSRCVMPGFLLCHLAACMQACAHRNSDGYGVELVECLARSTTCCNSGTPGQQRSIHTLAHSVQPTATAQDSTSWLCMLLVGPRQGKAKKTPPSHPQHDSTDACQVLCDITRVVHCLCNPAATPA